tara:strand:- start:464 stop:1048 length:585 start_codon:yes stop_codon:yes gene_type:complete
MFNGIIYNTGKIKQIFRTKNSMIIGLRTGFKLNQKDLGSSISCNGVCLTLTKIKNKLLFFYLSSETLSRSNFFRVKKNDIINLEKSIKHGDLISGHYSFGHIDCCGKIKKIIKIGQTWTVEIILRKDILKKLVDKGSITINGVSLTISKVKTKSIILTIIPHTLKMTNLIYLRKNDLVNIEIDMLSKYISKYFK